jgi:hypothetical protein
LEQFVFSRLFSSLGTWFVIKTREILSRRPSIFRVGRRLLLDMGNLALCKPLLDSIEEALIQLQYAVADYYSFSANDPRASNTLGTPLGELRKVVISTQIVLTQSRLADKFYSTDR